MSTPPLLRNARRDDLDALCDLLFACVRGMRDAGIEQWDEVYPNRERLAADLVEETAVVAEDGGEVVGLYVLNDFQDPPYAEVPWAFTAAPVGVVHRVMVHPKAQGRGVARALMMHAERRAVETGIASLRLDAFLHNPRALRLYDALGFRRAGTIELRKGTFYVFEKDLRLR